MMHPTAYRNVQVDGLNIFFREAGPKDAPTLLLLHGLPSSSRMFEPLFARLSDRYHLVAPDYPGFGHSDWPDQGFWTGRPHISAYRFAAATSRRSSSAVRRGPYPGASRWIRHPSFSGPRSTTSNPN